MNKTKIKWLETKDGIWPMYTSQCMRVWVTQYARRDWRWTVYYGQHGVSKIAFGHESSREAAQDKAERAA